MSGSASKVETQLGEAVWQIDARYQPVKLIGSGAYGVVCEALDRKTGRKVAIKKIQKAFDIVTIAKRTLLEIKLLRHFQEHDNVITIKGILQPPPPPSPFTDVYIVMELLETDLHRIIYSRQELTTEHVRYFLYQLLCGLKYIHSAKVLHRDIKPGNLLLNGKCDLKICDFGMARGISSNPQEHSGFMTAYVATRWYRAPEVMLSFKEYTYAIDLWSAACIFAEMLGRKHLFPSRTYVEHLNLVLKHLGLPSDSCISRIGSQKAQKYLRSLKPIQSPPLKEIYPHAGPDAIDLLDKMLRFDPDDRITIAEALNHPYLKTYHDSSDEPTCTEFDFDFEADNGELSAQDLREKILEEVRAYASTDRSPFPVSPGGFKSDPFPVSPAPSFRADASAASAAATSPSFFGSALAGAARPSKRLRTESPGSAGSTGSASGSKHWAAAIAARAQSRTPPPGAKRKSGGGLAPKAPAESSPLPPGWGLAVDGSAGGATPTRKLSSPGACAASGKLVGTPDSGPLDVQWLEHIAPEWLTDQQLHTELEMGAPNVFKPPP